MYFFLCIWGDSRRKPFVSRSDTTHIAAIFVRGVQVPFSPSHFTTPPDRFAQYSKAIWDKALLPSPQFLQYTKILNYGRGVIFRLGCSRYTFQTVTHSALVAKISIPLELKYTPPPFFCPWAEFSKWYTIYEKFCLRRAYSLFMCQDEDENEAEDERFSSF